MIEIETLDDYNQLLQDGDTATLREEIRRLEARLSDLNRAAAKVFEGFETHVFVHNTEGDMDSGWSIRAFPYLRALNSLHLLLRSEHREL